VARPSSTSTTATAVPIGGPLGPASSTVAAIAGRSPLTVGTPSAHGAGSTGTRPAVVVVPVVSKLTRTPSASPRSTRESSVACRPAGSGSAAARPAASATAFSRSHV
jgi:hypothetical protein